MNKKMTINDYKEKLQKLQAEVKYIDQQRELIAQQLVKTMGAIEALEAYNCETCEPETPDNIETTNG